MARCFAPHRPASTFTTACYRRIIVPEARLRRLPFGGASVCTRPTARSATRPDGRGTRQTGFTQPPRNFTDEAWRRSTSPRRVFFAIREGIPGTAMAAWRAFDVAAYVRAASAIP